MKKLIGFVMAVSLLSACVENETLREFSGNEVTYQLVAGSEYNISGVVTLKERVNGSTSVIIKLNGTDGDVSLPVHLHLGNFGTLGADIAALLNPVKSKTGESETLLTKLADESEVLYSDLIQLDACIKVHLSDTGAERDIVLAGGNIGAAFGKEATNGKIGFALCKSN